MPWCDDCSKFWNPPELEGRPTCPRCGRSLATPVAAAPQAGGLGVNGLAGLGADGTAEAVPPSAALPDGGPGEVAEPGPGPDDASGSGRGRTARAKGAPWHFKLLVVGVTVYMVYRIYWLVEWLPKHL